MSLYDFFTAIRLGNVQSVKEHLKSGKFTVKTQNDLGFTGFLFACTYGQQEVATLLLDEGADLLHQDNDGWSCLHKTAFCGHFDLFKVLLEKGADASLANAEGKMGHEMAREPASYKALVGDVTPTPFVRTETVEEETGVVETKEAESVDIPTGKSSGNTMLLFPGQGAQKVGMVSKHLDTDGVRELFDQAQNILGYDILDICQNGPEAKLNDTLVSQPAIYLTSLAALLTLKQTQPDVVADASATSGFSLGEYTALVFAGAMDWQSGLKLIQKRAEAMQQAAKESKSGMVSLVGLDDAAVNKVCQDCDVQVANYLFPKGRVISGGEQEIEKAITASKQAGAQRAIKLKVSGAFHSKYMASAQEQLDQALQEVTVKDPSCTVYANITSEPYSGADEVKTGLAKQLTGSVRWEETIQKAKASKFYEVGPGNQLRSMMRRIDMTKWKVTKSTM